MTRPKPRHRTRTDRLCYELDTLIAGPLMEQRREIKDVETELNRVILEVYRIQREMAEIQDKARRTR